LRRYPILTVPSSMKSEDADIAMRRLRRRRLSGMKRVRSLTFRYRTYVFGQRISEAVVIEADRECACKVEPADEKIKEQVIASSVVNFDETGIRVKGKTQRTDVAGTPALTYYTISIRVVVRKV